MIKNEADTIRKDFNNHSVEYHIARYFPCLDSDPYFLEDFKKYSDTDSLCYMRFEFKTPESYIVLVTLKIHDYSRLATAFKTILKNLLQDAMTDAVLADLQAAIVAAHPDGSATETKTVDVHDMITNNQPKLATLLNYKLIAVEDQALKSDEILSPMTDIGKYDSVWTDKPRFIVIRHPKLKSDNIMRECLPSDIEKTAARDSLVEIFGESFTAGDSLEYLIVRKSSIKFQKPDMIYHQMLFWTELLRKKQRWTKLPRTKLLRKKLLRKKLLRKKLT